MKVVTCSAAYGSGGLGQHFTQVIEAIRSEGQLAGYYTSWPKAGDAAVGHRVVEFLSAWVRKFTPVRFSPGWKNFCDSDFFDRAAAKALVGPVDDVICFGGQALHTFQRARQLGARRLHLMAANSHVENVFRLHNRAIARDPLETSWLNRAQINKTIREYELADVIHVASEYTRQSLLDAGISTGKLARIRLETAKRFCPPTNKSRDGILRIVSTGSLTVMKGIPLLVEAFSRVKTKDAELTLVGGWATRGMRQYLQAKMAADPRIKLSPGDPLPHLHRATVFVHPSWEDGWAYAPAEALACGVPVIVTADTGMKELVTDAVNGFIVPTGDVDAIVDRLNHYVQTMQ